MADRWSHKSADLATGSIRPPFVTDGQDVILLWEKKVERKKETSRQLRKE